MKTTRTYSFTKWLGSQSAVSFTLAIGIIFLITNYQTIVYRANPDNLVTFTYPYFIQVVLSHLDSFFFGLATAIVIFQGRNERQKVLYCIFEGLMIFLNLNRNFLDNLGLNSQFILGGYIAVFSGFTLYFLGSLAKRYNELDDKLDTNKYENSLFFQTNIKEEINRDAPESDSLEEQRAINEHIKKQSKIGFKINEKIQKDRNKAPKGYAKAIKFIDANLSINKIAEFSGISRETAKKCKEYHNQNRQA